MYSMFPNNKKSVMFEHRNLCLSNLEGLSGKRGGWVM